MLTSSGCTSGVRQPGITATLMSRMVSDFDVLSCVTFMRSSKHNIHTLLASSDCQSNTITSASLELITFTLVQDTVL